mmetsp:Transcript_7658/g.19533  ORF Transcript_7658/g.19533 Transcript_7658/m.19533 type:complete len:236 (-) Transcript_7658:23-730(-)
MRPASRELFISAVEGFTVAGAQCTVESDRAMLVHKVETYFVSVGHFEEFARAMAIALISIAMCRRAGRSFSVYEEDFQPWVHLAARLGYRTLERALRAADPVAWRNASRPPGLATAAMGRVAADWQARYLERVNAWAEASVYPALAAFRSRCVADTKHGPIAEPMRASTTLLHGARAKGTTVRNGSSRNTPAAATAGAYSAVPGDRRAASMDTGVSQLQLGGGKMSPHDPRRALF